MSDTEPNEAGYVYFTPTKDKSPLTKVQFCLTLVTALGINTPLEYLAFLIGGPAGAAVVAGLVIAAETWMVSIFNERTISETPIKRHRRYKRSW